MSELEPGSTDRSLKVLIVEDDANLRAALAALVSREGARDVRSLDARRGAQAARETALDAVLVDLTLPDGSGLELLGDPDALGAPEYIVVTGDASARRPRSRR